MRLCRMPLLAVLGLLAVGAPAGAQDPAAPFVPPRFWFGLELHGGDGTGEFGDLIEGVWGFELVGRWLPDARSRFATRLDLGILTYGEETSSICLEPPIGCRIGAEVTTSNDILFAAFGPELRLLGDRLYFFGTVGVSQFATSTSLSGVSSSETLFTTENFSDTVVALRFGGGWRFLVKKHGHPVRIDVGAEYHRNGVAEYLLEGDIVDNPDGTITILPNRSEANVVTLRIGVSMGFGRGG